jgi:hypothetical protein
MDTPLESSGKSVPLPSKPLPSSFSFYVLKGETLAYPASTYTPSAPYLVKGEPKQLDIDILTLWFHQSIVPLVGDDAAVALKTLLDTAPAHLREDFLQKAIAFRNSLR